MIMKATTSTIGKNGESARARERERENGGSTAASDRAHLPASGPSRPGTRGPEVTQPSPASARTSGRQTMRDALVEAEEGGGRKRGDNGVARYPNVFHAYLVDPLQSHLTRCVVCRLSVSCGPWRPGGQTDCGRLRTAAVAAAVAATAATAAAAAAEGESGATSR